MSLSLPESWREQVGAIRTRAGRVGAKVERLSVAAEQSLSWRNQINLILEPGAAHAVAYPRGLRRRVVPTRHSAEAVPAEGAPWQSAVNALGEVVGTIPWRSADARVAVSNHFVHFALVPGAHKLRNDTERTAAARHQLHTVYGAHAETWRVVLGESARTGAAVAAGIEAELVDAISAKLADAALRPLSIEPLLATAFNLCRDSVEQDSVWLAVVEPGRVTVAYLQNGTWQALRSHRLRTTLAEEFPVLLERNQLAAGAPPGRVILASREGLDLNLSLDHPWSLQSLRIDDSVTTFAMRH